MTDDRVLVVEMDGRPRAQARARVVRAGGRTWAFSPKTAWRKQFTAAARRAKIALAGRSAPIWGVDVPVRVEMEFWLPSRKKYATARPDLDNLEKSVLDSLSDAGVWDDDCQVVEVITSKRPAEIGRVRVVACEWSSAGRRAWAELRGGD